MGKVIAAAMLSLLLGACAATAPVQEGLLFCRGAKPLRPAAGETAKLSEGLVAQIHAHNALGAKACGWKP